MVQLASREKRIDLRLPVRISGRDQRSTFAEATRTLNISGGGVCFQTERQLPVGSRVDLRIEVPAALRRHFGGRSVYAVRAVVCRLEHFEDEGLFRIGARFLGELEA